MFRFRCEKTHVKLQLSFKLTAYIRAPENTRCHMWSCSSYSISNQYLKTYYMIGFTYIKRGEKDKKKFLQNIHFKSIYFGEGVCCKVFLTQALHFSRNDIQIYGCFAPAAIWNLFTVTFPSLLPLLAAVDSYFWKTWWEIQFPLWCKLKMMRP